MSSFSSSSLSSSPSSLLTTTERNAFDAFLSTVDNSPDEIGAEWAMYAHLAPPPLPHVEGSNALAKATKDLIALRPPPKLPAHQTQAHTHHHPPQPQHRPIAPAPNVTTQYLVPTSLRSKNLLHSPSASSSPTDPLVQAHTYQRTGPSPSKRPRTSASPPLSPSPPVQPAKSSLLTAQQKKANHIQSEQKRRANIRKGYEALCDTVPTLRDAIRADEESNGSVNVNGNGGGTGRRKRVRSDEGEKVDGRAGPRSESVVLQKTIEHIQGLLDEKRALILRLQRARDILGPGHPALYSDAYLQGMALWERGWDGGKGLIDVDGEHDSDSD